MIKIEKYLVDKDNYGLKCPHEMVPKFITIHEAGEEAPAFSLISWMRKFHNPVSFHYAVDDKFIWQGIEDTRTAYHAGDGAHGPGNNSSIAIEICYPKGPQYKAAVKKAATLTAYLMLKHGIDIDHVVQHNHWSSEDCPKRMRKEGKWGDFLSAVQRNYKAQKTGGVRHESRKI